MFLKCVQLYLKVRLKPLLFPSFLKPYTTMPSDLAKKKAAKKKEAAKARQRTKKPDELNEEAEAKTNGAESNGEKRPCL